jgi:hypothetical protein
MPFTELERLARLEEKVEHLTESVDKLLEAVERLTHFKAYLLGAGAVIGALGGALVAFAVK